MKAILKLILGDVMMPMEDGRIRALKRYALAAFGSRSEVHIFALNSDRWAWLSGKDDARETVSMDVRLHRGPGATAALAAALQCLEDQRKAREDDAA